MVLSTFPQACSCPSCILLLRKQTLSSPEWHGEGIRAVAWRRRIMLSRKSAVISKLSVTRESLMRSPLLLPVCLCLHSILSFSLLLSVSLSPLSLSLFNGCFSLSRPLLFFFFACLWEQVKDSVWSQHVEKKASSLEGTGVSPVLLSLSVFRCVQFQRSVSKPHRQRSSVKARPLFWNWTAGVQRKEDETSDQTVELLASRDQD